MTAISAALLLFAGLAPAAPAAEEKLLNIGDPAPALKVTKWVKGKPVESFEKGHIYVVEFWATWCGPCRRAIPHLTELATKYRDKVTVVGVNVFEGGADAKDDEILAKVDKFVEGMGDRMGFPVAVDGAAGFMGKNWVEAALEEGIPATFVVGADGKIAWIGHPGELDDVLEKISKGTFDGTELAAKRRAEKEEALKERTLLARITTPLKAGKPAEALAELDKVLAENPTYKGRLAFMRFRLLLETDESKAYPFAKELAGSEFKDQPMALFQMAKSILDTPSLKSPDYATAISLARKADELTEGQSPFILSTLASAYFKKGDRAKAVETQEKAVERAGKAATFPEAGRKKLQAQLEEYREASKSSEK